MATTRQEPTLLRHIRRLATAQKLANLSDRELLQRFAGQRDEAAFATLVRRHGPMVLHVGQRVLHNGHDAEDVFQATFLVLTRKAGSIRWHESVGNWLYQAAYRIALKAKTSAARRRVKEARAARSTGAPDFRSLQDFGSLPDLSWREVETLLDEELHRLPVKYRVPLVFCYLEGSTRDEAAQQLGWSLSTLKRRLERGREMLRLRLVRRGLTFSAALLAPMLTQTTTKAALAPSLVQATLRSALQLAAGQPMAGLVSASVAELVKGGLKTMVVTKAKLAIGIILAVGVFAGAGALGRPLTKQIGWPGLSLRSPGSPQHAGVSKTQPRPSEVSDQPRLPADSVEVRGRVLDAEGRPFTEAKIYFLARRVIAQSEPDPGFTRVRATSNADGRFAFQVAKSELQPADDEEVRFFRNPHRFAAVTAVAAGYGPGWANIQKIDDAANVTLGLVRDDVPISGRVLDLEAKPVEGAKVRVMLVIPMVKENLDPWLEAVQKEKKEYAGQRYRGAEIYAESAGVDKPVVTSVDGRFRLTGIGRERLVALRFEGPTIETRDVYAVTRPGRTFELSRATLTPSGSDLYHGATFDHAAAPTMPIIGTVRDKDTGKPLAGVTVQAGIPSLGDFESAPSNYYIRTITDVDGNYRLVGLPKKDSLIVRAYPGPGQHYFRYGRRAAISTGFEPVQLDFNLKCGVRIRGRVTDKATGKPIKGANIEYFIFSNNVEYVEEAGGFREGGVIETVTAEDGSFSLIGLQRRGIVAARLWSAKSNRYLLASGADQIKGAVQLHKFLTYPYVCDSLRFHSLVEVNPTERTETVSLNLSLDLGKTVTGTILGADGKPLAGAHIQAPHGILGGGELQQLKTAQFTVTGINPKKPRYFCFIHKDKQLGAAVLLTGDEPADFTVRLQPCATVTGRVVDAAGQPMPGVMLAGFLEGFEHGPANSEGGFSHAMTDQQGRFRVTGVVPGLKWWNISVQEGDMLSGRILHDVTFQPGETKDLGDLKLNQGD